MKMNIYLPKIIDRMKYILPRNDINDIILNFNLRNNNTNLNLNEVLYFDKSTKNKIIYKIKLKKSPILYHVKNIIIFDNNTTENCPEVLFNNYKWEQLSREIDNLFNNTKEEIKKSFKEILNSFDFKSIDEFIEKLKYLLKNISNIKTFTEKLNDMYDKEFNEAFKQILILSKEDFINFISNGITYLLSELYGENIFENRKLKEIQKKNLSIIDKNYEIHFQKINKTWLNFSKIKNNNNENTNNYYLTNFRKHCCDTENIAFHNCKSDLNSKFISVEENKNIKYVICAECKMIYFSNFILCVPNISN